MAFNGGVVMGSSFLLIASLLHNIQESGSSRLHQTTQVAGFTSSMHHENNSDGLNKSARYTANLRSANESEKLRAFAVWHNSFAANLSDLPNFATTSTDVRVPQPFLTYGGYDIAAATAAALLQPQTSNVMVIKPTSQPTSTHDFLEQLKAEQIKLDELKEMAQLQAEYEHQVEQAQQFEQMQFADQLEPLEPLETSESLEQQKHESVVSIQAPALEHTTPQPIVVTISPNLDSNAFTTARPNGSLHQSGNHKKFVGTHQTNVDEYEDDEENEGDNKADGESETENEDEDENENQNEYEDEDDNGNENEVENQNENEDDNENENESEDDEKDGIVNDNDSDDNVDDSERKPKPIRNKRKRIRNKRKHIRAKRKRLRAKKRKKRKKRKQKNKKKHEQGLVAQPAHVIFASVSTPAPYHHYDHYPPQVTPSPIQTTTISPHKKKIKYILSKTSALKKKKKEYLTHLGQVIYPFFKFVAFFTVLNPFTLGIFLFSLTSPIIFGMLGFIALSFFVKPALQLLFDVKRRINVKRRRPYYTRRRQQVHAPPQPITIHKHYYHDKHGGWHPRPVGGWSSRSELAPAPLPPVKRSRPLVPPATPRPHNVNRNNNNNNRRPNLNRNRHRTFNPLLPEIKAKIESNEDDGEFISSGLHFQDPKSRLGPQHSSEEYKFLKT